jgi:hypothetical protein
MEKVEIPDYKRREEPVAEMDEIIMIKVGPHVLDL